MTIVKGRKVDAECQGLLMRNGQMIVGFYFVEVTEKPVSQFFGDNVAKKPRTILSVVTAGNLL